MNRYLIQGLYADAGTGKRVAFCAAHPHDAKWVFEELAALVEEDPGVSKVCRVNGRESIAWADGGRVSFHFGARELRGVQCDVVVVAGWDALDEHSRADIAMTTDRRRGELIRL